MAQGKPKELADRVRQRAIEVSPDLMEDYILSIFASEVPEEKRKGLELLTKLSGQFAETNSKPMPTFILNIGKEMQVTASVTPATVVDVEATEVLEAAEPEALLPPQPIKFDLNFDALLTPENSHGNSTSFR